MTHSTISQLGVLGNGNVGGNIYLASSTFASINNEIMDMELNIVSKEANVSAEITNIRLKTETKAAAETQKSTLNQVDEEYASAIGSAIGCAAGIGFGFKDFTKNLPIQKNSTWENEMEDTKAFRDAISPAAVEKSDASFNASKTAIEKDCADKIAKATDDCSQSKEAAEIESTTKTIEKKYNDEANKIAADYQAKLTSASDDSERDGLRAERGTKLDDLFAKQNTEIATAKSTIEAKFRAAKNDLPTVTANLEAKAKTDIEALRPAGAGNLGVTLHTGSGPSEEDQVIDRWVGNDMRAPKINNFKGMSADETALNQRAAELLKGKPSQLRQVRNTIDAREKDLQQQIDVINAQKQSGWTQTINSGTGALGQGTGAYYKTEASKNNYDATVENAIAESTKMAETAFQEGVRTENQAAEQARQEAIQIMQGYQQAVRG